MLCKYGVKFRLGAGFQSDIILSSMRNDFLYDRSHLIDLDREDDIMVTFEVVLLSSFLEASGCRLDSCVEYVREA